MSDPGLWADHGASAETLQASRRIRETSSLLAGSPLTTGTGVSESLEHLMLPFPWIAQSFGSAEVVVDYVIGLRQNNP